MVRIALVFRQKNQDRKNRSEMLTAETGRPNFHAYAVTDTVSDECELGIESQSIIYLSRMLTYNNRSETGASFSVFERY